MGAKKKTKTRTVRTRPPSLDPQMIADIAKLFFEHERDKEQRRLDVFQRAWACLPGSDGELSLRVALAVAYLGGGK